MTETIASALTKDDELIKLLEEVGIKILFDSFSILDAVEKQLNKFL